MLKSWKMWKRLFRKKKVHEVRYVYQYWSKDGAITSMPKMD